MLSDITCTKVSQSETYFKRILLAHTVVVWLLFWRLNLKSKVGEHDSEHWFHCEGLDLSLSASTRKSYSHQDELPLWDVLLSFLVNFTASSHGFVMMMMVSCSFVLPVQWTSGGRKQTSLFLVISTARLQETLQTEPVNHRSSGTPSCSDL